MLATTAGPVYWSFLLLCRFRGWDKFLVNAALAAFDATKTISLHHDPILSANNIGRRENIGVTPKHSFVVKRHMLLRKRNWVTGASAIQCSRTGRNVFANGKSLAWSAFQIRHKSNSTRTN